MPADPLAPQQDRSRKTLDKLLQATIDVLDKGGLEACTIPRVAAAAGVSPAAVYRRYDDKDALLHAAFLHVLQQSSSISQKELEQQLFRPTLEATAERIIASLLRQYRAHPQLLRAMSHFMDSHAGSAFAGEAQRLIAANLQRTANIVLDHSDRIRHPEPKRAALFAVLSARASIEAALLTPGPLWLTALALNEKQFSTELTRAFVAYLRRKP